MDLFADINANRRATIDWSPPEFPSLDGIDEIILDTETEGLRWWAGDRMVGLAIGWYGNDRRIHKHYLPIRHRGGNLDELTFHRWAKRELRGKRIRAHNSKFDNHVMREEGIDLEAQDCLWTDTAHAAALLDDRRRKFKLDDLAQEYLKDRAKITHTDYTGKLIDKTRMGTYHAGEIAGYALEDVDLTGSLWDVFAEDLEREDLWRVIDLESRLTYATCEMERNACPLDVPKLEAWAERSEREFNELILAIHRETGVNLNTESPKDWERLFRALELTPDRTDSGQAKRDDETLKRYHNPVIEMGRRARQLGSLRSKYICAYLEGMDPDGRIRTALHQLRGDEGGTISGRYSSSGMKINGQKVGFNGQQVFAVEKQSEKFGGDYVIREVFVPGSGLLFSVDAAQIEYRLFAHYANSQPIIEAYREDPWLKYHKVVHAMLTPYKPDLLYKATKNLNFAYIYGAGPDKLSEMLGLPVSETLKVIRIYEREIPEARKLRNLAESTAKRRGYVRTLLGRRARFPGGDRSHKALNSIIQGTAADIMKEKTIEVHKAIKAGDLPDGTKLRLTVHDELVGDVPNQEAADAIAEILNTQTFDLSVPILWEMETGENWAACA